MTREEFNVEFKRTNDFLQSWVPDGISWLLVMESDAGVEAAQVHGQEDHAAIDSLVHALKVAWEATDGQDPLE